MSAEVSRPLLRYAIIGAGMSGILAAKRLLERDDVVVTVFEKSAQVGGTWRETRSCHTPERALQRTHARHCGPDGLQAPAGRP